MIQRSDMLKFFRPSYSKTVWKTQGSTITEKYAIHQFDRMVDDQGDRNNNYVALTRSINPANVMIVH